MKGPTEREEAPAAASPSERVAMWGLREGAPPRSERLNRNGAGGLAALRPLAPRAGLPEEGAIGGVPSIELSTPEESIAAGAFQGHAQECASREVFYFQ